MWETILNCKVLFEGAFGIFAKRTRACKFKCASMQKISGNSFKWSIRNRNAISENISTPLWALPLFSGMSVKGEILDWMGSDFLRLWSCCGLVDELDVVYTQFIFYKDHFNLSFWALKMPTLWKYIIYFLSLTSSHWVKALLILFGKGV